jgi:hypothetical protein
VTGPLHIGDNIVLSAGEVLGVFEKKAVSGMFLELLEKNSAVRNRIEDPASSVIVVRSGKVYLYHSKISPGRLIKRAAAGTEEK